MNELSNETIKNIFYEQIKNLTLRTNSELFDLQFSDMSEIAKEAISEHDQEHASRFGEAFLDGWL